MESGVLRGLESTPQRGSAELSGGGVSYLLRGVKPPLPPSNTALEQT